MVTLWFKPGPSKLQTIDALKKAAHLSLREAKDAYELGRVTCDEADRELVMLAIEENGGTIE